MSNSIDRAFILEMKFVFFFEEYTKNDGKERNIEIERYILVCFRFRRDFHLFKNML